MLQARCCVSRGAQTPQRYRELPWLEQRASSDHEEAQQCAGCPKLCWRLYVSSPPQALLSEKAAAERGCRELQGQLAGLQSALGKAARCWSLPSRCAAEHCVPVVMQTSVGRNPGWRQRTAAT